MSDVVAESKNEKKSANVLHMFRARERTDREGKGYFFAGGSREPKMVDLSKVVIFVFEDADDEGNPIMKVSICEGNKPKS